MKLLFILVNIFSYYTVITLATDDPDVGLSIEELIRSRGFDVEVHNVLTKDGYILTLHRLVDSKENLGLPEEYYHYSTVKKPVLIQHGIFSSSIEFLINSPFLESNNSKAGDNLGFGLHLTGQYDVWLGNTRGNFYSKKHINLLCKFTNKKVAKTVKKIKLYLQTKMRTFFAIPLTTWPNWTCQL